MGLGSVRLHTPTSTPSGRLPLLFESASRKQKQAGHKRTRFCPIPPVFHKAGGLRGFIGVSSQEYQALNNCDFCIPLLTAVRDSLLAVYVEKIEVGL